MIGDLITLVKRVAIVLVLIAFLAPGPAHQLMVQGWDHLMILLFGHGGGPSVKIRP